MNKKIKALIKVVLIGLAKFFEEDGMIYIFDAPDRILNVSPEYAGKLGFVCEYD